MSDQIFLHNYKKSIEIGAFQEERQILQDVLFQIDVALAEHPPFRDEAVDDILSYDVLVNAVEDALASRRYNLLEVLAEDIAREILRHAGVKSVEVEIQKLGRVDGALGVRIARDRLDKPSLGQAIRAQPMIVVYEGAKLAAPSEASIILPMQEFEPIADFHNQHILVHELGAQAWALGKTLGLPVVDTFTESESLCAREQSFVRAFGSAIFATRPSVDIFTPDHLITWMANQLQPSEIQILKD